MTEVEAGLAAEGRSGCGPARLSRGLARAVLVWPLICMASQVGQALQMRVLPEMVGGPYEGAVLGIVCSAAIGVALWRRAVSGDGWRAMVADLALASIACVWLVAVVLSAARGLPREDAAVAYGAALVGGVLVLLLTR